MIIKQTKKGLLNNTRELNLSVNELLAFEIDARLSFYKNYFRKLITGKKMGEGK